MSSYIKFMFKYLFSADDDYSAGELAPLTNASQLLLLAQHGPPKSSSQAASRAQSLPEEEPGGRMQQQAAAAKCLELTRKLTLVQQQQQQSIQLQQQPPMRSFADFESWFRAALANQTNHEPAAASNATRMATGLLEAAARTAVHNYQAAAGGSSSNGADASSSYSIANGVHLNDHHHGNLTSKEGNFTSRLVKDLEHLDLLECYQQMQLKEYYSQYDIFIGLRIASTLTILFIVFILFVIYKTGCRDNQNQQQSSLLALSSQQRPPKSATASVAAHQGRPVDSKLAGWPPPSSPVQDNNNNWHLSLQQQLRPPDPKAASQRELSPAR